MMGAEGLEGLEGQNEISRMEQELQESQNPTHPMAVSQWPDIPTKEIANHLRGRRSTRVKKVGLVETSPVTRIESMIEEMDDSELKSDLQAVMLVARASFEYRFMNGLLDNSGEFLSEALTKAFGAR